MGFVMSKYIFLFFFCVSFVLNASSIEELKKLQYSEQTIENVFLFKQGLEELAIENNVSAILMLALAYESGSHWEKDKLRALKYYKKAASLGSSKAFMKLGVFFYNQEDYESAKKFFVSSLNHGGKESIKYLLEIAIINQNKKDVSRFLDLAKKNHIPLDELILKGSKQIDLKKSEMMHYIEDKTFKLSKDYLIGILKIASSLNGAFKNLGYEVEEYIIHNGLEPTIELVLKKIPNTKIDEEMAMFIAGDNILKISILKSLMWANAIEPFMIKEVNHRLSGVEIEVGATATAKIVTQRIDND